MNYPKVVGFIPVYNAEKFLSTTLDAVASIDYPNFSILIGDDCSTDQSLKIAKEFESKDSRFQVISQEENVGWFKNSASLWKQSAAVSEYCFLISHDDIPKPNYISEQIKVLEENPETVLCCPQMEVIHYTGWYHHTQIKSFGESEEILGRLYQIIDERVNYWWTAYHGLHKSSSVLQILPLNRTIFNGSEFKMDLVWLFHMALQGKFITIPDTVYIKKIQVSSLSEGWKYSFIQKIEFHFILVEEIAFCSLKVNYKIMLLFHVIRNLVYYITNTSIHWILNRFRILFGKLNLEINLFFVF